MANLEFDPQVVGEAETNWWIAHNNKDKAKLLFYLGQQLKFLYNLSDEEVHSALMNLSQAIQYHDDRTLSQAHEAIAGYYRVIKDSTGLSFDPSEVGTLELRWWDIHDDLEGNPDKTPLAQAFTHLYARLYSTDDSKLVKAGQLKAQATYEHDKAESEGISPEQAQIHWQNTMDLLTQFYVELKSAINSKY